MKIAVSSQGKDWQSEIEPRFGRSRWFILIDTQSRAMEVVDNGPSFDSVQGAGIATAKSMVSLGVEHVISGRVGPKALSVLEAAGIPVMEVEGGTVEEALEKFKEKNQK